jgi:hypothetical protein
VNSESFIRAVLSEMNYAESDTELAVRHPAVSRRPELGYGTPSATIWTITVSGPMTSPAVFFPTRLAVVDYLELNAGSERSLVTFDWSDSFPVWKCSEHGPLPNALFLSNYWGCGEPERVVVEEVQITSVHDGESVWVVRAESGNAVWWGVDVAGIEEEAEQLRVLYDVDEPSLKEPRGWGYPDEVEAVGGASLSIERVRFGDRWQHWDLD